MELLVRVVDKEKSGDPAIDAGRTERGDVIAIKPDGSFWTTAEREWNEWELIKIVDLPDDVARSLVAREHATSINIDERVLRRRAIKLNLDLLGIGTIGRSTPGEVRNMTTAQILASIIVK